MDFTVEASLAQLKKLFRLRDDVKALLEEISLIEMDLSSLLGISFEFFIQHLNKNSITLSELSLSEDDITRKDNENTDRRCSIKISLGDSSSCDSQSDVDNSERLAQIQTHLQVLFEPKGIVTVDNYLVLLSTFKFIMSKRMEIIEYFTLKSDDTIEETKDMSQLAPCEICGDLNVGPKWFCDALVCGKCISFFMEYVDDRFKLHCTNMGHCRTKDKVLDISCHYCRMKRCVALGIVEKYEMTFKRSASLCCNVCHTSGNTKSVHGINVCLECDVYLRECMGTIPDPEPMCTSNQSKTFDRTCKHCLLQQFKALGVLSKSSEEDLVIANDEDEDDCSNSCIGCDAYLENEVSKTDTRWNASLCKVCETFTFMSMTTSARKYYACPSGELGNLCEILPDDGSVWTQKCNYCWFRILEIGGVAELWEINENPTTLIRH